MRATRKPSWPPTTWSNCSRRSANTPGASGSTGADRDQAITKKDRHHAGSDGSAAHGNCGAGRAEAVRRGEGGGGEGAAPAEEGGGGARRPADLLRLSQP